MCHSRHESDWIQHFWKNNNTVHSDKQSNMSDKVNSILRYVTVFRLRINYFSYDLGAKWSCNDFINENGYGACQKRDINLGILFNCFVNWQSLCKYLVESATNPEIQLSAEECEDKNEGRFFCMISDIQIYLVYRYKL